MDTSSELPKLRYLPFKIVSSSKSSKLNSTANRQENANHITKQSEDNSYGNNILNKRKKYIQFIKGLTAQENLQFQSSKDYLNISYPQILINSNKIKLQGRKTKIINNDDSLQNFQDQSLCNQTSSIDVEPKPATDFFDQN